MLYKCKDKIHLFTFYLFSSQADCQFDSCNVIIIQTKFVSSSAQEN